MQVSQVAEVILLEVSLDMVFNFVTLEFIFIFVFSIVGWLLYLLRREMLHCVLVPNHHEAVTVQITARHFVLLGSISFGGEYYDIDEVSESFKPGVGLPNTSEKSDVSRVTAGVLGDYY
jgi:hypothetical protein